jgi:hypothetical protein
METIAIWLLIYIPAAIFWLVVAGIAAVSRWDVMRTRRAAQPEKYDAFGRRLSMEETAKQLLRQRGGNPDDPAAIKLQMDQMR